MKIAANRCGTLTSVQADQTSKLGWSRDTYMNTYSPALPKQVCLSFL
jgi:hypothetical protein